MRVRIFLPLLAFWLAAAAHAPLATIPIDRNSLPWWQHRFAAKQAELAARPPRLVFYGDSIMQFLEQGSADRFDYQPVWQHYYGGRDAVDLGFKGDPTSSLIWRLLHGETAHMQPRLAIVLIGANNFGKLHWSSADTVAGVQKTVAIIEHKLPHTHILLLGVLPSLRSDWVSQSTQTTNQALDALYGQNQDPAVTFLDVGPIFLRAGRFDVSLFIDPLLSPPDPPLHPSPEGWRRIAARIEPIVAKYLGDRPRPPMQQLDIYGR